MMSRVCNTYRPELPVLEVQAVRRSVRHIAPYVSGPVHADYRPAIVCQSPFMHDDFCTMALSFDPRTRTTIGFVGLQLPKPSRPNGHPLHEFFDALEDVSEEAINPLLVPALLFGRWVTILGAEHHYVAEDMFKGGLARMEKNGLPLRFSVQDTSSKTPLNQEAFDRMHRVAIGSLRRLTNNTADFVPKLGDANLTALERLRGFCRGQQIDRGYASSISGIRSYLEHMQVVVDAELQHRSRLTTQLNISLQVVSILSIF